MPGLRVEERKAHPNISLAVILTVQLMLVLDVTVVNIALPQMQEALHFSQNNLSWVLNAYLLTFGGLLLLGGRMGDLFGRKRLFIGGVALFTLASLTGGLATSAGWLVAARAVQGIGAALAAPSALALLMTSFPEGPAAQSCPQLFHRGLQCGRLHRLDPRWDADCLGLVALGTVHQRAHRHRRRLAGPALHPGNCPPARSPRSRGSIDLDARHGRTGLRVYSRRLQWLE